MPAKKVKKTKPVTKISRQTMSPAETMEKNFRAIPGKLPAQFRKDITDLKKKETKLQSSLQKMQKQQVIAKNKHQALTTKSKKTNLTAAAKKQIATAKKAYDTIQQATLKTAAQLAEIKQHGKILSQKQAKFTALCKFINSLDKEWEKKKSTSVKPKAKKTQPKPLTVKKTPTQTHTNPVIETIIDEVATETVEATS